MRESAMPPCPQNPTPSNGKRLRAAFAALITAVSLAGVATPASATPRPAAPLPTTGQTSPGQKSPHPVARLCDAPTSGTAACLALRRTDVVPHRGTSATVTPDGYGPGDLADAYDLPAGAGAGATVAIVDAYDDPNAEADLGVYRAQYGLPACTTDNGCFRKVNQRGETTPPSPDADWAGEITLDVDMVSAVCPACHILLVESDDNSIDNLAAGVDQAVALGAKYVSNSYGAGEDPSETDYDDTYSQPGVVITASTGDDGYGASYPATSPGVTAVGGTSLTTSTDARGWDEKAWSGAGSGCSSVEAKPSFQKDTGCDKRAEADVSAVADPNTGVAVYDTYQAPGWDVYGGTSASSPIIASTYALAGPPVSGTSPNSYPYSAPSGSLNDVTSGSNGTCTVTYLCTAGTGYDGPTGLGTPNGVAAFTTGPHGTLTGTVSDADGTPISGAKVASGDASAVTDDVGKYTLVLDPGQHTVTASAYGYTTATTTVTIAADQTLTQSFTLTAVPRVNVSGTVTDGSGHGWPLYSKITLDGVPGAPVYTDPFSGHYSVNLPQNATYTMHVAPVYPGYATRSLSVAVKTGAVVKNLAVLVDHAVCEMAPGYHRITAGTTEHFDGTSAPAGWTVTGDPAQGVWTFDDPGSRGNQTGGAGNFAVIDSDHAGTGKSQDSSLVSPVYDFSSRTRPTLQLNSYFKSFLTSSGDIDVTTDAGKTWTTLDHLTESTQQGVLTFDLTNLAGDKAVQFRFRYQGSFAYYWEVDDVFVGQLGCGVTPGGLVAGFTTDHNTGAAVTNATVVSKDVPADKGTSSATPEDGNIPDGFYWLFSSVTGSHAFTAASGKYTPSTATVAVAPNYVTRQDFSLEAGRLTVSAGTVGVTEVLGASKSTTLTFGNSGTKPVHVELGERPGGFVIAGQPGGAASRTGAAVQHVAGHYTPGRQSGTARSSVPSRTVHPSDAPWVSIADYPVPISNNVAAYLDGKLYSFGGFDGTADTADGYVYDPDTQAWTKTAPMSVTREAAAAFVSDGKIVVTGGWGPTGDPTGVTEAYDPVSNSWTTLATNPKPHAAAGFGVVGGQAVLTGGCATTTCGSTDVQVYDLAGDSWSSAANYPQAVSWEGCGGLSGTVYCAGGTTDAGTLTAAYAYDPGADSWTAIADLPADAWGGAAAAANGQLLISGGAIDDSTTITNEGWSFDPTTGAWTDLPNSNTALYRGGSACGFYKVGGGTGTFDPSHPEAEVLPGYDSCGSAEDVTWLSENPTQFDVAPGASQKVTVTMDSSVVSQPGTYTASITVGTDTPYSVPAVAATMTVTPPATWGKITGVVTGTPCGGTAAPLAGATIEVDSWAASYTLSTDKDGRYALWLDKRNNPLTLIAARDGWAPQTATVTIKAKASTTKDFALKPAKACK